MNESSVSTPFMEKLRERLPAAVVFKLHDGSTVGVPDCCVCHSGRVWWFEFKLFRPTKSWDEFSIPVMDIAAESPLQLATMRRLSSGVATGAAYICWTKRTKMIALWIPGAVGYRTFKTTPEVVEYIASEIEGSR